jgi:hypothetical protein
MDRAPLVETPRPFAGYTFGYNDTRFVQRAHDVMTAVALARRLASPGAKTAVVGLDGSGRWALAARAADPSLANVLAVDLRGFTLAGVPDWTHPDFMPGAGKYGDLAGMIAAAAPATLWIQGSHDGSETLARAYQALEAPGALQQSERHSPLPIDWLITQLE